MAAVVVGGVYTTKNGGLVVFILCETRIIKEDGSSVHGSVWPGQ